MIVGDKININGTEYTVWLIEDNTYHLKDELGNGICCDVEFIKTITEI